MSSDAQAPYVEGISYRDKLPIDWVVVAGLPSAGEQHRLDRANEALLQQLLLKDELHLQEHEDVDEGGYREHLLRLEAKLDLLVGLVTEMVAVNGNLPSRHDLVLGTHGLCVFQPGEHPSSLKEGVLLRIRLYLDTHFPHPLELFATLVNTQMDSFSVELCPVEAHLQDLLDKFVFRQHRRDIAFRKRGNT